MNDLYLQGIFDFLPLAFLTVLSVYHLFIFIQRIHYKNELYNLYFALFTFSVAIFLLLTTRLYAQYLDPFHDIYISAAFFEGITTFFIIFFCNLFMSSLLNVQRYIRKILYISYLFTTILVICTSSVLISGYEWYHLHLQPFVFILAGLSITTMIITYALWIRKKRLYKNRMIQIIFIGFIVLVLYILINKLFQAFFYSSWTINYNNIAISITFFIFSFAVSTKFSNEHRDLIELKQHLEDKVRTRTSELEQAKSSIEEASRQKSQFFVNIAHETKTPLTLIKNYLDGYIKKTGMNDDLQVIEQNLNKLITDMDNFLDSEKLERGHQFYNHGQITAISNMAEQLIKLYQHSVDLKNINLNATIQPDLHVEADPLAIERIINNLMMNAIKFTNPEGTITVEIKSEHGVAVLRVSDTGIGIQEDNIEDITRPFYQITHLKENYQGIGIGLSIVSRIVESLNGTLTIKSSEHIGSNFTIELPVYIVSADETIAKTKVSPPTSFITIKKQIHDSEYCADKHTILLVEDNPDMLLYLKNELSLDFNIFIARNGAEAISRINSIHMPDVIISDIMMDNMDGIDFFKTVAGDTRLQTIPFIFLTALSDFNEKLKLLISGAVDYIHKPFSINELKARIFSILKTVDRQRKRGIQDVINSIQQQIDNPGKNQQSIDIWQKFESSCNLFKITARQKDVVKLIYEGCEYKEIGVRLGISTKTVMRHVQDLYEKCDVHSKIELIHLFF